MTVILMYHDVVDENDCSTSGFSGAGADRYKIMLSRFQAHMAALTAAFPGCVPSLTDSHSPFALTFDDGGASGLHLVAEPLAARGWKGHFFIVTGQLGMRGFLSVSALRAMLAMGHQIGTHTVSHPQRLSTLPYDRIVREWSESRRRLEDVLGIEITSGAVPGGFCNRRVREAAVEAGLNLLLTSEPTVRYRVEPGIKICGRFAIVGNDDAVMAVALVRVDAVRRQKARRWRALGLAKGALGPVYPALRESLLRLRA
ncbi:MAG: polysaccharide deacetylase family protein [Acidiferrobacter sp.]